MSTGDVRKALNLWVLQECLLVVSAASTAVKQWLCIFGPAPKVHDLAPCLVDTEVGSVDKTANICVCEELAPVCERHPADANRTCVITL